MILDHSRRYTGDIVHAVCTVYGWTIILHLIDVNIQKATTTTSMYLFSDILRDNRTVNRVFLLHTKFSIIYFFAVIQNIIYNL